MNGHGAKRLFNAGDVIMRQGDDGTYAYIIEDGLVEIEIERTGGRIQHLGTRGPGAIIGEMAIVDRAPRSATVRALKDCKMLEISREDLEQRLKKTDPVVEMISRVILTRYRDTLTRAEILGDNQGTWPPPETLERTLTTRTDVLEKLKIANEFKEALESRQLSLHYQPIVELTGGYVVGFEALMRWTHPEKGPISPGIFIPIAEQSELIVDASRWAVEEACFALKRIEQAVRPKRRLYMSVNFSSHDFAESDFVNHVTSTVDRTGVEPAQVRLEITERALIQQPAKAKQALDECRSRGMGVAIDDFGTGYSSLRYLHYYPIETLKVDQSFTRVMQTEARSFELVRSIIALGKNLNMTVVTEGVESSEEARLLRAMGCDTAQGYYFAKPMTEDAIIEMLGRWNPTRKAV